MKRISLFIIICIFLLTLLCGCSAKADFPSSEEVREIIPAQVSVDITEHLPIIEEQRTLTGVLGDISQTFTLDESVWEKNFGESSMQFYRRIGDTESNEYICIYEDGDTSVSLTEYDAYYRDGKLSDVYFRNPEINLYLDEDDWSWAITTGDLRYSIEYNYSDQFLRAYISHMDDGLDFRYENGKVTDLYYSARIKSETLTENFDAYYDDNGNLKRIYYYAYPNDDSLFSKEIDTVYDSNYISEDAPAAPQPEVTTVPTEDDGKPAETKTPAAAETPEKTIAPEKTPKPERTGFLGKVLDEIEKDFGNIKNDIVEDFQ